VTRVFSDLTELKAAVGTDLGHSAWLEIDQARIDRFAEATGDFQWIHVDAERANDGPYGRTIAHVRRRCHNVVTSRCESGGSTGDSKRPFALVRKLRDALQDNENHPMSDWGSSGRRFKSCQPDRDSRRSKPYPCPAVGTKSVRAGGMDSNPVHNPSRPARPSTAARAVS
jgi:hypothetical protein